MTAKIKLNAASGGGSFSLQAPSSSANTRVMTLPDTADGTILTTTNPKAGNIIQVVSTTKTTSFSSSSTTYVDITGMSASITPTSSSNKIYMMVNLNSCANTRYAAFRFVRGSTNIALGTEATGARENITFTGNSNSNNTHDNLVLNNQAMSILDDPSTTSATIYKVQGRIHYATGTFYVNRQDTDLDNTYIVRAASTITLMEVAA